ncbi:MAG TPA: hypothetical protein VFN61_07465 [Acidimicrobiales bacterium]|nr:hypothetical protein [Acidimicrobiales bacterium]
MADAPDAAAVGMAQPAYLDALSRVCLPASGWEVALLSPDGYRDQVTLEAGCDLAGAVAFSAAHVRVLAAQPSPGAHLDGAAAHGRVAFDAGRLPVADIDFIVVNIRAQRLGDRVVGEAQCNHCASLVDISFSAREYLGHHSPRRPRSVRELGAAPGGADGDGTPQWARWWQLQAQPFTSFRLPTGEDVLSTPSLTEHREHVLSRCTLGLRTAAGDRRVEASMAQLGPRLAGELTGICPECANGVTVHMDARNFCLSELTASVGSLTGEVVALAEAFHWSEEAILRLPAQRRRAYVAALTTRRASYSPAALRAIGDPGAAASGWVA